MAIKFLDISTMLIDNGVVTSTYAAAVTSSYAYRWSQGEIFDFSKSAVQVHRARLRRIGLDIAKPFSGDIEVINQK